jgi:Flp pilus assembly protein TadD
MHSTCSLKRSILLALSLLSACAAADPSGSDAAGPRLRVTGGPGALLTARHATAMQDMDTAAAAFRRALADDPDNLELRQQAFLANLLAGRPDAVELARLLPQNQAAMLLQANADIRSGNWAVAETRFATLPHQGIQEVMRPLLIAWSQQGAGQTDAALATLLPLVEGQRLRGIYALNAALIADLADRPDAGRLYRLAQAENGGTTLQLARMIASWQARQGQIAEAEATLRDMAAGSGDLSLALPGLVRQMAERPVASASDGIAEVYLLIAAALHSQNAEEFGAVLLRLALDLRPNLSAARLLAADVAQNGKFPETGLAVLAQVGAEDPLAPVAQLRRAAILQRIGNSDEALRLLDQIARDHPDRPEPAAAQGDVLRMAHRFAEAAAAYDRALSLIPNPGRAQWPLFYQRGIAHERAHMWPQAEADFLRALDLMPDQPLVLNYLGYSWTEQGRNMVRARQMIERAAALRPNDGAVADSLGWVLLRQGDVTGAVRQLERAVELDPSDSTVNAHLGDAYAAAGRGLEAQFQWRRALTLKPEPEDIPKLEAKLREGEQTLAAPATKP